MSSKFRVLISGGSIAGLTLALLLEQLGIDFLVLESHNDIAPQVGASIGLHPFGLRIYDQLGCFDDIRALVDYPLETGIYVREDGKPILENNFFATHLEHRHGYPVIFVDRQMILQILYDHIKDKSKVLIEKRVSKVNLLDDGVEVETQDGSMYKGDILVGADGVHSKVKSEMWRIADAMEPGYIPESEKTATPTTYKCIFGISTENPGIPPASALTISRNHSSYLVITGPGNRVYWFLFINIGKTELGNIPRYTEADKDELVAAHADDNITETLTFGDLYKSKLSSVLTALPEYSFKKWHFRRIMTIGDAAHKFHPLSGYGGNSAAETATVLANNLAAALSTSTPHPTTATLTSAFARTQAAREARVWKLIKETNTEQRMVARENLGLALFATLIPYFHRETGKKNWREATIAGARVEKLPVPKRPRFVPYDDEMPAKPLLATDSWLSEMAAGAVFAGIAYLVGSDSSAPLVLERGGGGAYGTAMLFAATLVALVESHRHGAARSLIAFPALFTLLPPGLAAPLYFLAAVLSTADLSYVRPIGRPLPAVVAAAALPVVVVAFAVAGWLGLAPVVVASGLLWAVARVAAVGVDEKAEELELYKNEDVAVLRRAYVGVAVVAAGVHSATVFGGSGISSASLWGVEELFSRKAVEAAVGWMGRDAALMCGAVLCWQLYSVWWLRRWGFVKTGEALRAAGLVVVGQVVVGPGAAWALLWRWREGVIAGLSRS